ncbi:hypothetical protein BS78_06G068900, partial [Paspalum vaginatum]
MPPASASEASTPWNSSYMLQIKMLGNRKHTRKDIRYVLLEEVVDACLTNSKDLVESITKPCPTGYLEVPHVQYYDEVMKKISEVKSDQDLMLMFEKHSNTKVVTMFMGYCNAFEPYELITEWTFDEQLQQDNNDELDDDNYHRNPFSDNERVGVDEEGLYLENVPTNALPLVVRKNPFAHDCYSTRREKKVKNATKHWVCEK